MNNTVCRLRHIHRNKKAQLSLGFVFNLSPDGATVCIPIIIVHINIELHG